MGPGLGLGLGLLGNKQVQVHGLTTVLNCGQRLRTVYQRLVGGVGFGFGFGFLGVHFGLALAAFGLDVQLFVYQSEVVGNCVQHLHTALSPLIDLHYG